jgi:hypothetical protein
MRITLLDGTTAEVVSNDAIVVHGADAAGAYLGLVDPALAVSVTDGPPPDARPHWRWAGGWHYDEPLADTQAAAAAAIDAAAGMARLRYITDVPGQAATYAEKRAQAQAFVGAPGPVAPAFVQAEADAMGVTALQAAQYILATALAWEQIGPAIERERRRGKIAVQAASTAATCTAALQAALGAIAAI